MQQFFSHFVCHLPPFNRYLFSGERSLIFMKIEILGFYENWTVLVYANRWWKMRHYSLQYKKTKMFVYINSGYSRRWCKHISYFSLQVQRYSYPAIGVMHVIREHYMDNHIKKNRIFLVCQFSQMERMNSEIE